MIILKINCIRGKPLCDGCKECEKGWEKLDLQKVYDLLAKLLCEDKDYEIKFTVTRKEE